MKPLIFSEGDSSQFEQSLKEEMEAPIKHFEKELAAVRTGRASTKLIENIKADAYGNMTPLRELATLASPDSRLLTIQPWDKSLIETIEKGIQASELGINPVNDGTIIRLQFPMMSTARREELIKVLGKKTEECRIGIRNIRKDFHNELRDAQKKKLISEDFSKRLSDLLQKITDTFIGKTDELSKKKEAELRQF